MMRATTRTLAPVLVSMLGLAACASPASRVVAKEDLLAAAGFQLHGASTPDWKTVLTTLPAHRFTRQVDAGQTVWMYPDPSVCACVYVGTDAAWATYRHLTAERKLMTEQETMAFLADASMNVSGGNGGSQR